MFEMVKATNKTDGRARRMSDVCRTQVYEQEGNGCTWQPRDRTQTHASQGVVPLSLSHSRFLSISLSLYAVRPIPLSARSIPYSRPSLFEIQPAGRALAQNNRNCGEISVPPGPSLWTIVAPRRATKLLDEAEHRILCVSASFRSFRSRVTHGWFDFRALFNLIAL